MTLCYNDIKHRIVTVGGKTVLKLTELSFSARWSENEYYIRLRIELPLL